MYTYASGEEFNGEWVKGKKSGKGSFRFLNGDLYTGEFRDDDINGLYSQKKKRNLFSEFYKVNILGY